MMVLCADRGVAPVGPCFTDSPSLISTPLCPAPDLPSFPLQGEAESLTYSPQPFLTPYKNPHSSEACVEAPVGLR